MNITWIPEEDRGVKCSPCPDDPSWLPGGRTSRKAVIRVQNPERPGPKGRSYYCEVCARLACEKWGEFIDEHK